MKKNVLLALIALVFFACSKEDGSNNQQNSGDTKYLSLSIYGGSSKANESDAGSAEEGKIGAATVLCFNEYNTCLGSVEFGALTASTASTAKEVPAQTKKVFVVINNTTSVWDLSTNLVKDKKFGTIINEFKAVTVANIATNNQFVMTNQGVKDTNPLVGVTLHATADEAEAAAVEIKVDRVSSKVSLTCGSPTVTNGTFTFVGWELNTVNKTTSLYSELDLSFTGASAAIPSIYRKDKNYLKTDFPSAGDDAAKAKYLNDNYTWLVNGTGAGAPTSSVARTSGTAAYCTENTMEAAAQLWGLTTKVVVKGQFIPTSKTAGESYFTYDGVFYSAAEMKAAYKVATATALKADLIIFLTAAGVADVSDNAKIDAAIDALDEWSGLKDKTTVIRYFHNAVSYYDALIRHDDSITTLMALGRYGVVRNNSYALNVTSVSGPGTPWIPDPTDPKDPTKPIDPDDNANINLSIKVTVNPWVLWKQDVELGK